MLSDDLASLSDWLREVCGEGGVDLTPKAMAEICGALDSMAEDARALERHTVPLPARLVAESRLPENVVPLRGPGGAAA